MVTFAFSVIDWKQPLWEKIGPKKNCQFKLKLGT